MGALSNILCTLSWSLKGEWEPAYSTINGHVHYMHSGYGATLLTTLRACVALDVAYRASAQQLAEALDLQLEYRAAMVGRLLLVYGRHGCWLMAGTMLLRSWAMSPAAALPRELQSCPADASCTDRLPARRWCCRLRRQSWTRAPVPCWRRQRRPSSSTGPCTPATTAGRRAT